MIAKTTELPEKIRGNCLSIIQSTAAHGQDGMRKIAAYVVASPTETLGLKISELAERSGTSIASVSRFCNKIGYDSYRAFQIDLTASLANSPSPVSDHFRAGDNPEVIIDRALEMNRQSITDTKNMLDRKQLISVARLISDARRVFLVGIGGSGLIANVGALRFEGLGINVTAITDPYRGLLILSSVNKDDVVIGISHTGRTAMVIKLLEFAKERGAHTVGITNYVDSALAAECDFPLITSFRERRVNAAVSSSAIAQMSILDCLYFVVGHIQGPRAEELALEIEEAAEELIRTKS